MDWNRLITNKRLGQESRHSERHDDRTEFRRDYDRLIFSAPFRRLQNKTQVFPLPGSVFVHNRLTHSLEVASVGMSLGHDVGVRLMEKYGLAITPLAQETGQIVATACLAHDLGNPPFGHSGERAIQTFFSEGQGSCLQSQVAPELWSDLTHFEGNANAFRLLTHRFKGRRQGGFAMTYSTLASIVKYPHSSALAGEKGKFGFFESERGLYERLAHEMGIPQTGPDSYARHPLVYLVEAADDICYEIMDIEDSHKLRILSYDETADLLLGFFGPADRERILRRIDEEELTDDNEKIVYMRACVVGKLENCCAQAFMDNEEAIAGGRKTAPLVELMPQVQASAYRRCAEMSAVRIYRSKPVLDVELAGYRIIQTLMEQMTEAVVHPGRFYSQQLIDRVSSQYDIHSPELETRLMAVLDYISGMTDVYALDVFQKIEGFSLPII